LGVAWILVRGGFEDEVVAAGLLHDVVEDCGVGIGEIEAEFGLEVAELVGACTERKLDEMGRKRPWRVRKEEALERLAVESVAARAVALADKLDNLRGIERGLLEGEEVWNLFHASREEVIWYYRTAVERFGGGDERVDRLSSDCGACLGRVVLIGDGLRAGH
jgi:(p)ppGpp synthase/HD superfamily hydrolase